LIVAVLRETSRDRTRCSAWRSSLVLALLGHRLQVRAKGGLGDRLRVVVVVLLALAERPHVDRRDDPRLEPEPPERPADEVGAEAGLHAHNASRQRLEHLRQGEAPDLQAQHALAGTVEADEVEGVLADVDADHR
jgi:hypothetical protein